MPAFGLTDLSQLLRSDAEKSLRSLIIHTLETPSWKAWSLMEDCIASEEQMVPFVKENGMGVFEYHKNNPDSAEVFNDAMTVFSQTEADTVMSFYSEAWKELERKEATVLDVGGGHGLIMIRVKQQCSKLKCQVVDLKEVIDSAPEEECGVDFISGDFFKPDTLPISDVIFMKYILHDWSDEDSRKIFESYHVSLSKGGKLILAEAVLPGAGDKVKGQGLNPFFLDAQMMILVTGRERTAADWTKLLHSAGFKFENIVETPLTSCQFIEARKV